MFNLSTPSPPSSSLVQLQATDKYLRMVKIAIFSQLVVLSWIYTAKGQMVDMSPMDQMQLTAAVREIVHPQATPSFPMMTIATRQGGPPTTLVQMLEYTPHFVELAMQMGVKPPGTNGTASPQAIRELMISRGTAWMQRQASLAGMTGGSMGLGSEMTGIGLGMDMGSMAAAGSGPLTGGSSATTSMAGFSPLSLMLLGGGMEMNEMALLGASGMGHPFTAMYFMQNML